MIFQIVFKPNIINSTRVFKLVFIIRTSIFFINVQIVLAIDERGITKNPVVKEMVPTNRSGFILPVKGAFIFTVAIFAYKIEFITSKVSA